MKTIIVKNLAVLLALTGSLAAANVAEAQVERTPFHLTQHYVLPPIDPGTVRTTEAGVTHVRGFVLPAFNTYDDGYMELEVIFINQVIHSDGSVINWGTADRYAPGTYEIGPFGNVILQGEPFATFAWQGKESPAPGADGGYGQLRFVGQAVDGTKIQGTMTFRRTETGALYGEQSGYYLVPPAK